MDNSEQEQTEFPEAQREVIADSEQDRRVYIPHNDGWEGVVKPNSIKEYCYFKSPGEDHFHLLMTGEIYLQKGNEKCCLNCALRHGIATLNRLHWQSPRVPKKQRPPSSEI